MMMMLSIILSKGRKGFLLAYCPGYLRSFSPSSLKRGFYSHAVPPYYEDQGRRERVIPSRRKRSRSQAGITNAKHKRVAILEGMRVE
jgi:hypothetical protein